jgi:hypothetical protein
MPYFPRINYKTGINPSIVDTFDLKNLTGTQKLLLIGSRIFGNRIGGNLPSGRKILK